MSELIDDDLEEGEIADDAADVVIEQIVEEKAKDLPRRYILTDRKISKHKKNCKHATEYRKHKSNDFHRNLKLHRKHRKACPNRTVSRHSKLTGKNANFFIDGSSDEIFSIGESFEHSKPCKSAFKNFKSPPRKVLKGKFNENVLHSDNLRNCSKQMFACNKSKDKISKLKDSCNFKDEDEHSIMIINETQTASPKQAIFEIDLTDSPKLASDDEDEEELRRIALATCSKRTDTEVKSDKKENFFKTNSEILTTDNYEVIDMEMGNSDTEIYENDLYVIDTTPTYSEVNQSVCRTLESDFVEDNTNIENSSFLPSYNYNGEIPNFTSDVYCHELNNLNNNLYSSFEVPVSDSPVLSNQLDEEFEEELLRAELLANMRTARQKNASNLIVKENNDLVNPETQVFTHEDVKDKKSVTVETFNNRFISIENEKHFKERTVSIINDDFKKSNSFNDNNRSVTAIYSSSEFPDVNSVKKGVDIKVKLNNNITSNCVSSNKIILPQERLIISLNNETSSDESDDDNTHEQVSGQKSAVASLDALIVNARQESDVKKVVNNSNNLSDAVSWLSKADQEEYNSLRKILDAKKLIPKLVESKVNFTENSKLTLLKKQLLVAKKNLEKEKDILNTTVKDVRKKKCAYVSSKLKCQTLKEQLLAAEKVRRSNLQLWTKCSSNLQTLKKSVLKREAIINSLQAKVDAFLINFCPVEVTLPSHTIDHNYNISL